MAEPIMMPFGLWTQVGPRKHVLEMVQIAIQRGNFRGKDIPGHARRQSSVSCAKTAELIEMQFWMLSGIGPGNQWIGVHIGTTWRIPLNCPCAAAMWPLVKLL